MDDNVLGTKLRPCSTDPMTGYERSGFCEAVEGDRGRHHLCAVMTEEFLRYTAAQGNDLSTPQPQLGFPGLDPGDRWCLCIARWIEAHEDGAAPPVVLEATNETVLDEIPLETLREYAHDGADATEDVADVPEGATDAPEDVARPSAEDDVPSGPAEDAHDGPASGG